MTRLEETIQRQNGNPLLGVAVHRYNPDFVEIAAHLRFHILWIEMEHAPITFAQAADLCRLASAMGLLTMIRIPNARRENVLQAAECGPDMLDVPMTNSPQVLEDLIRHALYPPQGERGFYTSSRAVRFAMVDPVSDEQRRINHQLALVAQIETRQAVEHVEEICQVSGVDVVFLGLGDLSTSLGVPGDIAHPTVRDAVQRVIQCAKRHGKRIAIPTAPSEAGAWVERGADVLFCGSDTSCLVNGARQIHQSAQESLSKTRRQSSSPCNPNNNAR